MSKGKSIYFTKKELEILVETLEEWEYKVDEDIYAYRLKRGLGTAWGKLEEAKKKYSVEVQNGEGYYDSYGKFRKYGK